MMINKNERLDYIDIFKALLIVSVVVGHSCAYRVLHIIASVHMPAFFVLSGFFYSPSETRIQLRKCSRMILPYYFISIIAVNTVLCYQHLTTGKNFC